MQSRGPYGVVGWGWKNQATTWNAVCVAGALAGSGWELVGKNGEQILKALGIVVWKMEKMPSTCGIGGGGGREAR